MPGTKPQLPEPFTIERLVPLMDEAGVDRVIIVPPGLEGGRIDYAQEAVRCYPRRFAIMGSVSLSDPMLAQRLPGWKKQVGVLGIRLNIRSHDAELLANGAIDWFWRTAEVAGIPVMYLTTGRMHLFTRIAERHPQLVLIVDHMGVSSQAVKDRAVTQAVAQTLALAKYPNVSVKLSSAPHHSAEPYPYHDLDEPIRRLVDAYGPRRCYWGTDITNSFTMATYRQRVTHFTEELDFLSEEEKDWIMGRAICERLGWG